MFKHGPVDVILLYAKAPRFEGKVLRELEKQAAAKTIRVLDAMVVVKDASGVRKSVDIEDLPAEESAKLGFVPGGTESLFSTYDTEGFYKDMEPGTALMALAIEQTWAIGLLNTMLDVGTEMAGHFAVPAAIVDEAFASTEGTEKPSDKGS
jgi:hypothetical protein